MDLTPRPLLSFCTLSSRARNTISLIKSPIRTLTGPATSGYGVSDDLLEYLATERGFASCRSTGLLLIGLQHFSYNSATGDQQCISRNKPHMRTITTYTVVMIWKRKKEAGPTVLNRQDHSLS